MIYLFNSAYRPLYTRNILNTLFIPLGGINEYRYSVRGDVIHIPPESCAEFKEASAGVPIVIIFIDRFGQSGYEYHPLRKGRLVVCREKGDRLYFRVQLEDFIYPRNPTIFSQRIL